MDDIKQTEYGGDTERGYITHEDTTAYKTPEGVIGKDDIRKAAQTLDEYKNGKANFEQKIIQNEEWWRLHHWIRKNEGDPQPVSAWLFNSVANKHADAMDNYPEPVVLPREQSDEQYAEVLTEVLPVVLEQNEFEQTYSDMWWYKLKQGTGVLGVFWDSRKNNGLGDISIASFDLLNLFWEAGVDDIQKSKNLFYVELVDRESLETEYPDLKGKLPAQGFDVAQYIWDENIDNSDKCSVVHWYYKIQKDGQEQVHFCKFCGDEILYASENDPNLDGKGFYDHGKYPFVFDTLYPEAGMPVGYGCIDVCKSPQEYIDQLDTVILKHAMMGSRQRYFVRKDGQVNEKEFSDWTKDFVHYAGSSDPRESLLPVEVPTLNAIYEEVKQAKIQELKETSGNRDFSQGGTTSGVTAASAIAALQEAGSKLSRDMIKASYRAFRFVVNLCIELMRQFYTEERMFRVVSPNGQTEFVGFSGREIAAQPQGNDFGMDLGYRLPMFDVQVVAQKQNPFSTAVQNQRAQELYSAGFFNPQLADQALAALDMMSFEGKDQVVQKISENGTLLQQVQQLQQQLVQLGSVVDQLQGTNIAGQAAQQFGAEGQTPAMTAPEEEHSSSGETRMRNMRERIAAMTNVR